jgi:hypothetical protein
MVFNLPISHLAPARGAVTLMADLTMGVGDFPVVLPVPPVGAVCSPFWVPVAAPGTSPVGAAVFDQLSTSAAMTTSATTPTAINIFCFIPLEADRDQVDLHFCLFNRLNFYFLLYPRRSRDRGF